MKVLDLFSGLGGFSQAFKDRGHQVTTIDINKEFNPDICKDIMKLTKKDFKGYNCDIVLASPPCIEFSKSCMPKSWKSVQKGCNPDTLLLQKTLKIIYWIDPKYWVIENVGGARPYFYPFLGKPVKKIGSRYLWGNFPIIDVKPHYGKWKLPPSDDRSALRSLIPYGLSLALCNICENYKGKHQTK